MRLRDLAGLDLQRDIMRPPPGSSSGWRISIPGDEVKNGKALDYALGQESCDLLEFYLKSFRG